MEKKTLPSKLFDHPPALLNQIRRIAVEAGDITLDYFDEAGFADAQQKADGSPVTAADQAAEALIEKRLRSIDPDVPVIGEEAVSEGRIEDLAGQDYFWLVDPLDGTKEFVSGSGDYTVNIALIHKATPVMGVIYAPVKGELFAGAGPGTAIRHMIDSGRDKEIRVRRPPREGLTVVASRNHGDPARLDKMLEHYKVAKVVRRGSSLKLCAIAAGKADFYARLGPTSEWDTAAGEAILRAAGGHLVQLDGKPLHYGGKGGEEPFLNPEFIALSSLELLPGPTAF